MQYENGDKQLVCSVECGMQNGLYGQRYQCEAKRDWAWQLGRADEHF